MDQDDSVIIAQTRFLTCGRVPQLGVSSNEKKGDENK
jgi:hypothetical protein